MKPSRLTQRDIADYRAGATVPELQFRYGVSRYLILRWLRALGETVVLSRCGAKLRPSKLTAADIEGYRLRQVRVVDLGKKYAVSPPTIRRWLRAAGVTIHAGIGDVRFDLDKLVRVLAAREHGASLSEVGEQLGVTKQCVAQFVAQSVSTLLRHEIARVRACGLPPQAEP